MRRPGYRMVVVAILCSVLVLSSCSGAPSEAAIDGAKAARAGGLRTLESVAIPEPVGFVFVAERTTDVCGSLTSDRGGLDDTHIEGYSCALVRRAIYAPADGAPLTERDDPRGWAAVRSIQEALGLSLSPNVPTADGNLEINDLKVSISALIRPTAEVDIDMSPLWHANESVVTDDGDLAGKLRDADFGQPMSLKITTTVMYFSHLREE